MRRLLAPLAIATSVAVTLRVAFDAWYLNYDARYALIWARDVTRGVTPDFEAPFAPTPHPLSTLWSVLALPFGQGGEAVIVWLTLLAFGLLVYLTYRLGAELFSPWAGAVAAVVILTRPAMVRDTLLGYQDIPFAALVVFAALLEARRPRRGAPVLAVLALAGLLRPEAWVLAGLYWLYLLPRSANADRLKLALIVAAAPVLWAVVDYVVTGDALHSLHGTSELAETNDRRRDIEDAPYWTAKYFGFTLREPLAVAIPIGFALAWRQRARFGRPALLALSVVTAMTAVFMIGPLFGLPLIGRYVRTPSVFLALFAGLALAGWALIRDDRERRVWQALAAVAAIALAVFVPANIGQLRDLETRFDRDGAFYADLRAVAYDPDVRELTARCGPLLAADHRPIAHLRYWLATDPGSVGTVEDTGNRTPSLLVKPRRSRESRLFFRGEFPSVPVPPGARRVYANSSWAVFASADC
ncbi:MAG: hypothetical protein WKF94_05950 [Solirubrobacteraceae bacterium]